MNNYIGISDTFKTRSNRKRKTVAGRIKRFERHFPKEVAESIAREESL